MGDLPHMTLSRRLASISLVVGLVLGLASPAGAAASSSSAARKRQEQVRAAKAKAASQLNGLKASDDQLEKAVATLANQVRAQDAKAAAARQSLAVAEASVKKSETRIAETTQAMASLQGDVVDRAVAAYVRPQQSALAGLTDAKNLEDASRRTSMLQQVSNSNRDILDELRASKEDLGIEREKAAAARQTAAKRRAVVNAELGSLKKSLAERARLEAALDARIKSVSGEVEALTREDSAIQALISSNAARAAAQRASRSSSAAPPDDGGRVSGSGMRWPVNGTLTSAFGPRWGRLHAGMDIASPNGTPIRAAKGGTVIFAGVQGGYGNVVIIDHGGGLTTLYAHQSRLGTNDGAEVNGGEVIGYVGSTGQSTGNHVHFETRLNGSPQNPQRYLS